MNKEWSDLNKMMQQQLNKQDTYAEGIKTLFSLRQTLFDQLLHLKETSSIDDFSAIPFINADGYHSKTIAYSIWHIFRIEDIVAHTVIADDEQVFFKGSYQEKTGSPIITTGNELVKKQISEFSGKLNIDALYEYACEVKKSTEEMLAGLKYPDLKQKVSPVAKEKLIGLACVSSDEKAVWLIDYWCNKDVKGLIQMPFSRHWIMHVEAALRIQDRLHKS